MHLSFWTLINFTNKHFFLFIQVGFKLASAMQPDNGLITMDSNYLESAIHLNFNFRNLINDLLA